MPPQEPPRQPQPEQRCQEPEDDAPAGVEGSQEGRCLPSFGRLQDVGAEGGQRAEEPEHPEHPLPLLHEALEEESAEDRYGEGPGDVHSHCPEGEDPVEGCHAEAMPSTSNRAPAPRAPPANTHAAWRASALNGLGSSTPPRRKSLGETCTASSRTTEPGASGAARLRSGRNPFKSSGSSR